MFKKASMKIMPMAHSSSSTTSITNNQDVRPIQNLLSAEKAVLQSLQKLSVDYAKSAEALRTWGLSEDNDLGGVLTASTSLLNHFSLALSQAVTLGATMQRQLEVMAKKGESLDTLKQRRNTARQKVEETANQLNKMNPDNKYFSMHAEALKRLRKDVRKMDEDIRLEETILIDHKQTATKIWMRLKFGSLHECCEKGLIAGKYGKLAVAELEGTEDANQPGMPRNVQLQSKIESLVVEADRDVHAVGLSGVGSRSSDRTSQDPPAGSNNSSRTNHGGPPQPPPKPQSQPQQTSYPQNVQPGHFPESQGSSLQPSSSQPYPPSHQPPLSQGNSNPFRTSPRSQLHRVDEDVVDEFGTNGGIPRSNSGRAQFVSPPSVNTRQPTGPDPALGGRRRDSSVSEANPGPSHLQDPQWQQPAASQWNPYPYPDHPSQGGRHQTTGNFDPQYSAGPSQWHPQQPVIMRPPPDPAYPPQDPPLSQGGHHLTSNSSYSAGHPSHYPVIMRPPVSEYPPQDLPPSQGARHLNGDHPSYSAGPSQVRNSPPSDRPRPPESGGGGYPSQDAPHLGGRHNSTSMTGPPQQQQQHWQDRPTTANTRPPNSSEVSGYRPHDPPTSNWQNHPSDRPPPPPTVSGHHGNPLHGPINTGPHSPSDTGGYHPQDSPSSDGRHRGPSFSTGPPGPSSSSHHWPSNRYSGVSESTNGTSEGMSRARGDGAYNNHSMHTWGGGSSTSDADDSPPAYMLMGNPESLVSDTGP